MKAGYGTRATCGTNFKWDVDMIYAVTGGNGFIGRELVRCLLAEDDARVRILTSSGRRIDEFAGDERLEYVRGDLTNAEDLAQFLRETSVLFHLAGAVHRSDDAGSRRRMMMLHVDGTRRLLDAVLDSSVERVVLMSTSGTVGISEKPRPVDDDAPYALEPALRWPYYSSKIYQEKLAIAWSREHERTLSILRPSLALGPGDAEFSSTGDVKQFLDRGIPGIPAGGLSFVDARDIAAASLAAAKIPSKKVKTDGENGGPYRTWLLGAANLPFREYMNLLERISGVKAPNVELHPKLSVAGARLLSGFARFVDRGSGGRAKSPVDGVDPVSADMANYFWYIESSRAERELGFNPRSPEVTLRDTVAYIRERS